MQHTRSLREAIDINARPSRIWAVLTRPEYTRQYFYDYSIYSSWAKGNEIRWEHEKDGVTHTVKKGRVVNIIPGLLLEFIISDSDDPENSAIPSSYEMQAAEAGIRLIVKQELPFCPEPEFKYILQNWRAMLQKIKWLSEYS